MAHCTLSEHSYHGATSHSEGYTHVTTDIIHLTLDILETSNSTLGA